MTNSAELRVQLQRWVDNGLLSSEQAARIEAAETAGGTGAAGRPTSRAPQGAGQPAGNRLAVEALAYFGGALAVAALFLGIEPLWSQMSDAARLALAAGTAVALTVAGLLVPASAAGGTQVGSARSWQRLRATLWLLATAGVALALFFLGDGVLDLDGDVTALVMGLGSGGVALLFYLRTRGSAQHVGLFASLVLTGCATVLLPETTDHEAVFWATWLIALIWFWLSDQALVLPVALGRVLGAGTALVAILLARDSLAGQLAALGTVAALFVLALRRESIELLGLATLGTLIVIPSAASYFLPDDTQLAVPLSLLLIAAVLVFSAVTVARRRSSR